MVSINEICTNYSNHIYLNNDLRCNRKETIQKVLRVFQEVCGGTFSELSVKNLVKNLEKGEFFYGLAADEAKPFLDIVRRAWQNEKRQFFNELLEAGAPCGKELFEDMIARGKFSDIRELAELVINDKITNFSLTHCLFLLACNRRKNEPAKLSQERKFWITHFFNKIISSDCKFDTVVKGVKIGSPLVQDLIRELILNNRNVFEQPENGDKFSKFLSNHQIPPDFLENDAKRVDEWIKEVIMGKYIQTT